MNPTLNNFDERLPALTDYLIDINNDYPDYSQDHLSGQSPANWPYQFTSSPYCNQEDYDSIHEEYAPLFVFDRQQIETFEDRYPYINTATGCSPTHFPDMQTSSDIPVRYGSGMAGIAFELKAERGLESCVPVRGINTEETRTEKTCWQGMCALQKGAFGM